MHNMAEGFEAGYELAFARFLKIARRSAGEVQSEMDLALDAGDITEEELQKAHSLMVESKKLIDSLITYPNRAGSTKRKPTTRPPD